MLGWIFIIYRGQARINKKYDIEINRSLIRAEIAASPDSQYIGLSKYKSICANCGLLFVFPDKQEREIVMRNMSFPIDAIFIVNNKIINIAENLIPEGQYPNTIYRSASPADMILEVPGNFCSTNNIKIGDTLSLKLNSHYEK